MPIVDADVEDPGSSCTGPASAGQGNVSGDPDSLSLIDEVMKAFAAENTDPAATVARLKKEDADAKRTKKVLARQLKNAKRANCRLKEKAKLLSNDDLVHLLVARGKRASAEKAELTAQGGTVSAASTGSASSGHTTAATSPAAERAGPDDMDTAENDHTRRVMYSIRLRVTLHA